MATYYKYAERDADSQVNWAEVGKGLSDMLAETNRVRQEKKDALDAAQRETMKYLAETPNGEHVGARQSILEYANTASNQLRIMKQLMEQGQLDVKDYTIFRQNLTDNTNLAFNANKAYQENYADIMQRSRDGIASGLELNNAEEAEEFGNWRNIGWQIAPNGVVMAGKMIEQEVDGKKVRTLDKNPGGLRSMDYLNQAILGRIDKYDYESPVNAWVDSLGKNIEVTTLLGKIGAQGLSRSVEDITKRTDIIEGDKKIMYNFLQSENDKVKEVTGTALDQTRILYDYAKIAPNGKPYTIVTNPNEAKKGENFILKVVDPDSGGFKYELTDGQKKDAEEFIRTQMRAKYDKIEKEDVVNQVSRDEESDDARKAKKEDKEAEDAASMLGKLYYGSNTEVGSAIDYFKGMTNKDGEVLFKKITRDKTGVTILLKDGSTEKISFTDANGRPRTQEDFIRSAGPLLAGQKDINKALEKGSYKKGAKFNEASRGEASTKEKFKMNPDVLARPSQEAYQNIQTSLPKGFKVLDKGGITGNEIQIIAPDGTRYNTKSKQTGDKALTAIIGIEDFVNAYIQKQEESGSAATATTTVKGGRTR